MSEYKAQLLIVEAKLAKDPDNEELLSLKDDLIEVIKGLEEEEEQAAALAASSQSSKSARGFTNNSCSNNANNRSLPSSSKYSDSQDKSEYNDLVDKNNKRPLSEAELLAKKKEKNRKKKAKLREKMKEQLDVAESEKQSWQSFANKKGLKGVNKKSIFASPCSVTGKVGVGTNGIADAPSAESATTAKRKY